MIDLKERAGIAMSVRGQFTEPIADPKVTLGALAFANDLGRMLVRIQAGHKWAVDRGITATYVSDVTEGLQAFMRDLKRQGALINFEVYPDPELNTASQLEDGKVYWNIRFTDVPPAENPIFRFEVTNQWMTEVLDNQI
ncbi:phage tail sheath C-terminal domain-containing protein [Burkholderia gladioli]|uniref:phage tail sheath C-terminal domain-containing protein n=1 Tax=Burkholderia gladioli TaxID=28095 RepID=UPI002FE2ED25